MKAFKIELGILIILLLCSFTASILPYGNGDDPIDGQTIEERLIGTWIHTDNYRHLSKQKSFNPSKGGMAFGENGVLTVRQNVGWCGTPPITYGNYGGKWEMLSDSTARLEYEYWGGTIVEEIWVQEVSKNKLIYRVTNSETLSDRSPRIDFRDAEIIDELPMPNEESTLEEQLVGGWSYTVKETQEVGKTHKFVVIDWENVSEGIFFYEDKTFSIFEMSWFCGNGPPMRDDIYRGEWKAISENEVELIYKSGATNVYQKIKIEELDADKLSYTIVEYEENKE